MENAWRCCSSSGISIFINWSFVWGVCVHCTCPILGKSYRECIKYQLFKNLLKRWRQCMQALFSIDYWGIEYIFGPLYFSLANSLNESLDKDVSIDHFKIRTIFQYCAFHILGFGNTTISRMTCSKVLHDFCIFWICVILYSRASHKPDCSHFAKDL